MRRRSSEGHLEQRVGTVALGGQLDEDDDLSLESLEGTRRLDREPT
jgi:hypothetical protein